MSIKGITSTDEQTGGVIKGVGGQQRVGNPMKCTFKLNCDGDTEYEHMIKPTSIAGEDCLVILGLDFMSRFGYTVFDWQNYRISLGGDWVYFISPLLEAQFDINTEIKPTEKQALLSILHQYTDVFAHNPKAPRKSSATTHLINTGHSLPHKDKIRRYPNKWREEIDKQVKEMLENGIIRPSKSPYSSNVVLTSKKDQSSRFCVDYRTLNDNTVKDTYPIPNVQDLLDGFQGSKWFSQVDLAAGYWGIQIHEEDCQKTAFAVPSGKFEFIRMPFGLCNAQATFQRAIDNIMSEVQELGFQGISAYVDNIVIYTETLEEHLETLEALFHCLDKANVSLRKDKCEFAKKAIQFLGFVVNGSEVYPAEEKIDKVNLFPVPKTRKQLQRFLGMANFNRRFVKKYTEVCAPLIQLTSKNIPFKWQNNHQEAFELIKKQLADAPGLILPDWSREFHIRTDASGTAVGAVLYQINDKGEEQPVAYHSKALATSEKNWTVTEKEFFAIVEATRKFAPYCANKVHFHTDHLPLKYIRKQKDPRGKLARWICELENFEYEVHYIRGKDNHDADYLSRLDHTENDVYMATEETLNVELIQHHQHEDKHISNAINQLEHTGEIKKGIYRTYRNISLRNGMLYKGERIIMPKTLTDRVVVEMHGQYHAGVENTLLMIKSRFYWRAMEKDVKSKVDQCRTCAQCKPRSKPRAELQEPTRSFNALERVCIDVGTMPISIYGNKKFLLMVDDVSKFVVTAYMKDETSESIIRAIWNKWIPYFGVPMDLHSDQGSNVDGTKVRELCRMLGIDKTRSAPYHPEGNGSCERSIGSLKTMMSSVCNSRSLAVQQWDSVLDECTLAYNNTTNQSSGFSPAKQLFGTNTRLPIDNLLQLKSQTNEKADVKLVQKNAKLNQTEARTSYKERYDRGANAETFQPGDKVLLRRNAGPYPKMAVNWKEDVNNIPYVIEKRIGPVNYCLKNSMGKSKIYHRNMIIPARDRIEAQHTLINNTHHGQTPAPVSETVVITLPTAGAQSSAQPESTNQRVIDKETFTNNVLQRHTTTSGSGNLVQTRFGREVKPVQRLIDEIQQ